MLSFLSAVMPSVGPRGRIFANTGKPYYVAGEMVTGTITLEALKPIAANGINMTISGYEKTEWHELSHRTKIISAARPGKNGQPGVPAETKEIPVCHRHRGKRDFFRSDVSVYKFQGTNIGPGTYTFPFQYQLPGGIPGSFMEREPMISIPPSCEMKEDIMGDPHGQYFYDSDDEYDGVPSGGSAAYQRSGLLAVVQYKLKVQLDVAGVFSSDMYYRMPIVVHERLAPSAVSPASQTSTKSVIVCCCCNRGTCTVCARFDKLAYVAGETANVRADIQNDSKSELKTKVVFRRKLRLTANNTREKIFETIISQAQYDTVMPGMKSMDRPMPLLLSGQKVKPTSHGKFVICTYDYSVQCVVSMGSDIALSMPVTIYAPQPPPMVMSLSGAIMLAPGQTALMAQSYPIAAAPSGPLLPGPPDQQIMGGGQQQQYPPPQQQGQPGQQQYPQGQQQQQPQQQQYSQQGQQGQQQQAQQYQQQQQSNPYSPSRGQQVQQVQPQQQAPSPYASAAPVVNAQAAAYAAQSGGSAYASPAAAVNPYAAAYAQGGGGPAYAVPQQQARR